MKKNLLVILFFLALSPVGLRAQYEVGLNPISILWGYPQLGFEKGLKNDFAFEVNTTLGVKASLLLVGINYYFSPKRAFDGFGIGAGLHLNSEKGVGIVFRVKYRWIGKGPISLAVSGALGRALNGEVTGQGTFLVGYRFAGKKAK